VDLTSPDSRGIDTIDRLLHALRIPFLVLSAPADQDTPKLAVKHRAQESPAE
jgi:hypothetical protein